MAPELQLVCAPLPKKTDWNRIGVCVTVVSGILGLLISLHWFGPDASYGNCSLKLPTPLSVHTATFHLQNGLRYESQKQHSSAQQEFSKVLDIDPHFVGANLDLGSTYLMQGKLAEAEEYFNKELDTVDCLASVSDGNLPKFAYMLTSSYIPFWGGQRTTDYRQRLKSAESLVHYNLACLRLKQNDSRAALAEVKLAAKNCLIPEENFQKDPDLGPLRLDQAAFTNLTRCSSNNSQ